MHPGTFVSGCAALRGDVAPVLPRYFRSPFHPLTRIKNVITITYRVKTGEYLQIRLKGRIIISSKGNGPLTIAQQGRRFKNEYP
ncbi:hypothetical protein FA041_00090 [Escherichia coli]|nr:hypothetical protein [Escherichia coli]